MNEDVKYWLNIAQYDFQTAKSMLEARRYLYVAFMCHQAIEKVIKGVIVSKNKVHPPYTHNLRQLIVLTKLNFTEEQLKFIIQINVFNIGARYPAYKQSLYKICTKKEAENYYAKTKELLKWLKKQIK